MSATVLRLVKWEDFDGMESEEDTLDGNDGRTTRFRANRYTQAGNGDSSPVQEDYSIIKVAMGLRSISFAGEVATSTKSTAVENGAEPLRGDKHVLRDLLEEEYERPVVNNQETHPEMN